MFMMRSPSGQSAETILHCTRWFRDKRVECRLVLEEMSARDCEESTSNPDAAGDVRGPTFGAAP
jgi:hypothetical protein